MARAGSQQAASRVRRRPSARQTGCARRRSCLGGAQKQQASGQAGRAWRGRPTDSRSEEAAQAERVRKLAQQGEAMASRGNLGKAAPAQPRWLRQLLSARAWRATGRRCRTILEKLQRNLRDTARELAPTQPGAASSLRDALGGIDQNDLTNLVQRTADWLRRGINPNSNGTEAQIAQGLKRLDDQVRQAQQAAGSGAPGSRTGRDPGTQTAALDHVDRLRSQIESLSRQQGGQPGSKGGQSGRTGQNGQAAGQNGQRGQRGPE